MLAPILNISDFRGRVRKAFRKVAVLAMVLLGVSVLPFSVPFGIEGGSNVAYAQVDRTGEDARLRHRQEATELPEWARPQEPEGHFSNQGEARQGGVQTKNGPPVDEPPANRNVPLGGLEWLILAGAGYGFFKLREDD
jgi:hypothetical protein